MVPFSSYLLKKVASFFKIKLYFYFIMQSSLLVPCCNFSRSSSGEALTKSVGDEISIMGVVGEPCRLAELKGGFRFFEGRSGVAGADLWRRVRWVR